MVTVAMSRSVDLAPPVLARWSGATPGPPGAEGRGAERPLAEHAVAEGGQRP